MNTTFVKYRDVNRLWRWRLIHNTNHKTIADSGESYWNEADCDHGIALVQASFNSPIHRRT